MSHEGKKRQDSKWRNRGWGNPIDTYGIFKWEGVPVQFTTHARIHLKICQLDAHEIIDMLHCHVKCPKTTRHKKTEREVCSNKNGQIFRIILFETYCYDAGQDCWCVKNVEPA